MPWCHADYGSAEAAAWIGLCAANLRDDIAYDLGIYDAGRRTLLGGISINHINRLNHFGNIGYWVRESRNGAGIAARAVSLIAGFGFSQLNLMRLEIVAATGNHPSIATARRAGAVFEGIARQRLLPHGMAHDAAIFSLVPADFPRT